ncbi:MAG TPA: enoyl-CoA hydratase-related protein [Candidatus Binataceae bacterium]|nr:enoyl-CoA hydratase-related protein [Candidatus Binataceae bacterium]
MNFTELTYEKADRVATITFNRPQALNAYTPTLGLEMKTALHEADADHDVGAIIVTGAGRAFCSGFDVRVGAEANKARRAGQSHGYSEIHDNFEYMHRLGTPIIGAINGHCVFMGFTMTLFFDFRFLADNAKYGALFSQKGLALEQGAGWLLTRLVGVTRAADIAISGRLLPPVEALAMGLVNRVVAADQLMTAAGEFARDIAHNCAPTAAAQAKRAIYRDLGTDFGTAYQASCQDAIKQNATEDFKEARRSMAEKRAPRFPGR